MRRTEPAQVGSAARQRAEAEDAFTSFVVEVQDRLRNALVASFGLEVGREAAHEALVYGWEHWDRVGGMDKRRPG